MILPLLLVAAVAVPADQWLVGAWGTGLAQCASDSGIRFETDGTYSESSSEGLWSLAGNQLTVESTSEDDFGRSDVVRVKVRSGVEMELEWPDGSRANFRRCQPQARL